MNTSGQTYKELAIPYFREVFEIIDQVMRDNNIPLYLIGASAIALELLKNGIKPTRGTKDIDFAIMISSLDEYKKITQDLERKKFTKVNAPWTFYHSDFNVTIDILPYGEIEENEKIYVSGKNIDLHVLGFKEVLKHPDKIFIEESIAKIPPLPGMVLLKFISWNDRPEERNNDLKDILNIIVNFFEINFDEITEYHYDLLEDNDIDTIKIGARVLGRKIKESFLSSEKLSQILGQILSENLANKASSTIIKSWAHQKDWDIVYSFSVLNELQKGLED